MIIESLNIKKFRGFSDIQFNLGKNLTIIAGQNGTQKTTLLGILSQPFSISEKGDELFGEKPLCGGNYRSSFSEKFKLSNSFDKPHNHEWTLNLNIDEQKSFTVESINRKSTSSDIRFWQKGTRAKGSGYIKRPVIYLSLSRLFPIGEDLKLGTSSEITLSKEEVAFYNEWHNDILIIPDINMTSVDLLSSKQKITLGVNTEYYDWKMNSAGQDNIGKILLAILSFKRLSEKYKGDYKGGILAIDEIDATLYPASQLKLLEALRKFSSKYKIQIIFTTHSLTILKKVCEWQETPVFKGQIKVLYLQKVDSKVKTEEGISYSSIENKLNVVMAPREGKIKVPVFFEDKEGEIFFKAILKHQASNLSYVNNTLGCDNLIELATKQVKCFTFPESIIVLDGDISVQPGKLKRVNKLKNVLILPGNSSPERILALFLHTLSDDSIIWNQICDGYTKQFVFKNYTLKQIQTNREDAKKWFNSQLPHWGRSGSRLINQWVAANKEEVDNFIEKFKLLVNKYIK